MENFSAEIGTAADLVKARLSLRNYILNELNGNPFVVVRAVIAMTAMGELILGTSQKQAINIECSLVKKQGMMYLQYYCKLKEDYPETDMTTRSKGNFLKVMVESNLQNANANKLEISGLMLLK